jgi:hypothetical protein
MRGTKRKRREGVWEVRVYLGRDPVSVRRSRFTGTMAQSTKTEEETS